MKNPLLHPTRSARIMADGREIGVIGEAAPEVVEAMDIRGRAYIYELDFNALMQCAPKVMGYRELPRYPALDRHIAVVVGDKVEFDDLRRMIGEIGGQIVEQIELLDIYRGDQLESDQSSLTVSMVFRSRERTLTDEEVNEVLGEIKSALTLQFGASYR